MGRIFELKNYKGFESFEDYEYVRAYHACRPTSTKTYYENGICPYTKEQMKEEIELRLLNQNIKINRNIYNVDELFEKYWEKYGGDKVWFSMNKDILLGDAGHYLIYGSEFITGFVVRIGKREFLKNIGRPTLFVCNVPIKDIDKYWLDSIERSIKREYIEGDFGFPVKKLAPSNIIDVEYPNEIMNPLMGNEVYKYM